MDRDKSPLGADDAESQGSISSIHNHTSAPPRRWYRDALATRAKTKSGLPLIRLVEEPKLSYFEETQLLEVEKLTLGNESLKQDIRLRHRFAWALFGLSVLSIAAAFAVVITTGAKSSFDVSDSVLIALISSVVVEFLGILAIIARNLFPHN